VALTPDGQRAVSASNDKTLKVWDLTTGEHLHTLKHFHPVIHVALTADGQYAVSAGGAVGYPATVQLEVWDIVQGKRVYQLIGHSNIVNRVAVTEDNKYVVSASDDGTLIVWDLALGKLLHVFKGHKGQVSHVALTTNGQHAISASKSDNTLIVWEIATGKPLAQFPHDEVGYIELLQKFPDSTVFWGFERNTNGFGLSRNWNKLTVHRQDGTVLTRFIGDTYIRTATWHPNDTRIFAGDDAGRVLFLRFVDV
jgi:WD40 repeat protein